MSRPYRRNQKSNRPALGVVLARTEPTPIEAFVEVMATELGLGTSSSDRRTRRLLIRLTQWASAEGIALDRELILDPDTVERFATEGLAGDRSAATYRAALRRVGPLLTKSAPWEPRPEAIPRRQLAPPYSEAEIDILFGDALDQPTPARQRAALGFFVLGLGIGLDGRWATRVRGPDVERSELGVVVRVGEPNPRSVVATAATEALLLAMAELAGEECLVGGQSLSNRRTGQLMARVVTPTGHPRLAPARLRSTWMLSHIEAGTRLPELCQAAGLRGTGVLADLLPYTEPLCEHEMAAMLRGVLR